MSYPAYTCSPWKVSHGSTVILDWTDYVVSPPELPDAGQQVQVDPLVRAEVPFQAPRGNETRRLVIERLRWHAGHSAMWQALFEESLPAALPRGRGTVTIETRGGLELELEDAIIESWPARPHDGTATVRTLTIHYGALNIIPPAD